MNYVAFDQDKDRIKDEAEMSLLKRFRLYYRITAGENYHPCDAIRGFYHVKKGLSQKEQ